MPIPKLTAEELAAARAKAVVTRRARADLKNAVRSGELNPAVALTRAVDDPQLRLIRVKDFLKSVPRIGEKRADAIMAVHAIAASRRLGGLGAHQLEGLVSEFS